MLRNSFQSIHSRYRSNENRFRCPSVLHVDYSKNVAKAPIQSREFGRDISNFNLIESRSRGLRGREGSVYSTASSYSSHSVISKSNLAPEQQERLNKFYKNNDESLRMKLNSHDKKNVGKLSECAEYAEGISHYLKKRENLCVKKGESSLLEERERGEMINWMIEVHNKYKMEPETLFMCIGLFDRYTRLDRMTPGRLHIVALTCMLIASKYEEIYPPTLRDFMHSMPTKCLKEEILRQEQSLLLRLHYDISTPSAYTFIQRFAKLLNADQTSIHLAVFLAESQYLNLINQKLCPSQIAVGSIYLALKILQKGSAFNSMLAEEMKLSEVEIQQLAKDILSNMKTLEQTPFSAIRRKYMSSKYGDVFSIKLNYSLSLS